MYLKTLFFVLCLIHFSGSLVAKDAWLTVQANKKADSLLRVEIAGMVQKWNDRCMEKERTKDNTLICWRDAASAIEQYTSGLKGPVIEDAQRLRLAWLQRVEELQSSRLRQVDQMPPDAVPPPAILLDDTSAERSKNTRSAERMWRPENLRNVGKFLDGNDTREPSAMQQRNTTIAKRPQVLRPLAMPLRMKVVPAASLSQKTRLKKAKSTKEFAFGLNTREASSMRKAKLRAIRQEMKNIARRLQCLEQSKDIGHLEKCEEFAHR